MHAQSFKFMKPSEMFYMVEVCAFSCEKCVRSNLFSQKPLELKNTKSTFLFYLNILCNINIVGLQRFQRMGFLGGP